MRWPSGKYHVINLRLNILPLVAAQFRDFNLVVEMAYVADDGLVFHALHVRQGNHPRIARGTDKNVRLVGGIIHRDYAIALHRRLQGTDWIDLGDPHLGGQSAQGLRRTLADVAVAADDRNFAGNHHIRCPLDRVDQ